MKIAVTYEDGQIFQHFGHCEEFKVYETEDGKVQHVPLQYALTEYRGKREKLLELLACLNRAAEVSQLIAEFVEKGELFHPLRLTAEEAYTLLKQVEEIEKTGILCRIPNWWKLCTTR